MMNAMAGHDARDSTSVARADEDFTAGLNRPLAGLRIGVPAEFFGAGLEPEVAAATEAAAPALAEESAAPAEASPEASEEIEVTLWRPAPRRPKPAHKPNPRRDNARAGAQAAKGAAPAEGANARPDSRRGKPGGDRNKDGRNKDGRNKDARGKPHRGGDGRRDRDRNGGKGQTYTAAPRREKKADPNSPFAVLAGLKAELSGEAKGGKAKEPEKAE